MLPLLLPLPCSSALGHNKNTETKIGVLAKCGPSLCLKRWSATASYLSEKIPGHTFTIIPLSFEQIIPAVEGRKVDFLLVNSAIFAGLEAMYGVSSIATLETNLNGQSSTQFAGVIFTRSCNTDIQTIHDLTGKSFIAVDKTSLGGWIMALREFTAHGITPSSDFAKLTYAGTHDAVVYAVLQGQADAGTVRTDTLERMEAEGKISLTDFTIIPFEHQLDDHTVDNIVYHWQDASFPLLRSTHLYPEWPFAMLNRTVPQLAKAVASALYQIQPTAPAATTAHIAGWSTPMQYQSVRDCLQDLQLWPYENLGKIYLGDVLRKYCLPLCLFFLLICASLFVALYINRMNRSLTLSKQQLKKAYEKQEASFDQIIEEALSEIYIFDATSLKFLRVNLSAQKNLNYTSDELRAMTPLDIKQDFSLHHFKTKLLELGYSQHKNLTFETKHLRQDGTTYPVEVHMQPSTYHGKQVYVAMVLDISERKNAEKHQRHLEEQLQQAQKMEAIGTLAGGIAHDFNNILAAIIGFSELATLKIKTDDPVAKDIEQVLQAGFRARELVKQILTFSRKGDHVIKVIQPQAIIKEAVKMLSSSLPSSVDLRIELTTDCRLIRADPTAIHQIVINLCTNALHALDGEKGTISVRLACRELSPHEVHGKGIKPGLFFELSVTDTGQGITPENMERIFDPYFTTKEVGKGTGLGLAVIYGIMKECHGLIHVDSTLGKGTTFHLLFPVHGDTIPCPPEEEHQELPTGDERILIVDDDPSILTFCTTLLNRLGYQTRGIHGSVDALTLVEDNPDRFALLITDQTMPNMTGEELSKKILTIRPHFPIIICSGHSSIFNEDDARSLGIARYLSKPVSVSTLAQTVRQTLDQYKPT